MVLIPKRHHVQAVGMSKKWTKLEYKMEIVKMSKTKEEKNVKVFIYDNLLPENHVHDIIGGK